MGNPTSVGNPSPVQRPPQVPSALAVQNSRCMCGKEPPLGVRPGHSGCSCMLQEALSMAELCAGPCAEGKSGQKTEAIAASQETPSRRMPLTPAFANNPHTSTLGERRGQIGWVGSCRWQWLEVWGAGVCRTEGPPQSSRVRRGGGQWHAHEGRGVG